MTDAPRTPAIDVTHLTVTYDGRPALDDVTLRIEPGRYVGLVGPNGSGKSTLLRALVGTLRPHRGEIRVDGRPPGRARSLFSYVPQHHDVLWDFPITVWDVALMGRLGRAGLFGRASRADRDAATWSLERVQLLDRRDSLIGELSGGQQQRAFIARALAQEGRVLALDEPLTGVDPVTQEIILSLLAELHREGRTILIATHDLNTAADTCDTLCLLNGRLVGYGPMAEMFRPELMRETFGRHIHFAEAGPGAPHPEVVEHVIHH